MEMGKTRPQVNLGEYTETIAEDTISVPDKDLKDKIRQALLKHCNARDNDEIKFLLKRL
jgi:hypothetical protein